jgi:hypothetical protein
MKSLLITLLLLLTSCNVTYIEVKKTVIIFDGENMVEITGSELKDNQASQSADGKLSVPLVP